MDCRLARRGTILLSTLAAPLFALTTAAVIRGQEPAKDAGHAAVRRELDEFREKWSKTASQDRIRAYEQGIEEVRKSGVADKALKVGDKAPDFTLPATNNTTFKLSDYRGKKNVVLAFFPAAFTAG